MSFLCPPAEERRRPRTPRRPPRSLAARIMPDYAHPCAQGLANVVTLLAPIVQGESAGENGAIHGHLEELQALLDGNGALESAEQSRSFWEEVCGDDEDGLLAQWHGLVNDLLAQQALNADGVDPLCLRAATVGNSILALPGSQGFSAFNSSLVHQEASLLRQLTSTASPSRDGIPGWIALLASQARLFREHCVPCTPTEHPVPSLLQALAAALHFAAGQAGLSKAARAAETEGRRKASKNKGGAETLDFSALVEPIKECVLAICADAKERFGDRRFLEGVDQSFRCLLPLFVDAPQLSARWGVSSRRPATKSSANVALSVAKDLSLLSVEASEEPLLSMLQHLVANVPDRLADRGRLLPCVTALLSPSLFGAGMSEPFVELRNRFANFLCNTLALSKQQRHRAVAVDLAFRMLDGGAAGGAACGDFEAFLVETLCKRCSDRSPVVRSRAIQGVSKVLEQLSSSAWEGLGLLDKRFVAVLWQRCSDDSATVRKSATSALSRVATAMESSSCLVSSTRILASMCNDQSAAVRAAAAKQLSALVALRFSRGGAGGDGDGDGAAMLELWVQALLPLAHDTEESPRQSACAALRDCVFLPLARLYDAYVTEQPPSEGVGPSAAWALVALLGSLPGADKALPLVARSVLPSLSAAERRKVADALKLSALLAIERRGGEEDVLRRAVGASALLDVTLDKFRVRFAEDAPAEWALDAPWGLLEQVVDEGHAGFLLASRQMYSSIAFREGAPGARAQACSACSAALRGICKLGDGLGAADAAALCDGLLQCVSELSLPPALCRDTLRTIHRLSVLKAPSDEAARRICEAWAGSALGAAQRFLEGAVYAEPALLGTAKAEAAAFLAGELFLVGLDEGGNEEDARSACIECSPELLDLLHLLLDTTVPLGDGGAFSVPRSLSAVAVVSIGKVGLRSRTAAASSVKLLVGCLRADACAAVRSNALLALGDLCRKHTTIVDRQLKSVASCLQDGSPLVRRHAVLCLSALLLEDWMKWRGLLVHRFLASAVDEDADVRRLARAALAGPLRKKDGDLLVNALLEAVFVLNGADTLQVYVAAASRGYSGGEVEGDASAAVDFRGIDLEGEAGERLRREVYAFAAGTLSSEQKLQLTGLLCSEVLGGVVDGSIPVSGDGERRPANDRVVTDALEVLSGLMFGLRGGGAAEEEEEEVDGVGTARALLLAKGRALQRLSKFQILKSVLPILRSAKAVLERRQSPLQKPVLDYLVAIFTHHKADVRKVLDGDHVLKMELEFEVSKHQTAGAREKRRRAKGSTPSKVKRGAVEAAEAAEAAKENGGENGASPAAPAQEP